MTAKPTVIVTKSGTVFRPRSNRKQNARGEAGETEGLLSHLVSRGDLDVVYFGPWDGEDLEGVRVIRPDTSRIKPYCDDLSVAPKAAQVIGFEKDEIFVRNSCDGEPVCVLNVTGYSPTFSTVGNARGATVQAAAVLYNAPMLSLLQRLRLPRVCVVTDPRCYPRDQEMSYGWNWCRPRCLLGQETKEFQRRVGGVRYACRVAYGAPESWAVLDEIALSNTSVRVPSVCVAHAHVDTGIKQATWEPWRMILSDVPVGFELYGEGWEDCPFYDSSYMRGTIPADVVNTALAAGYCCPVVAHTPGYATGKPYVVVNAGSVPIFYGNDPEQPGCYDPCGLLQSLSSARRIVGPGTFRVLAELYAEDQKLRAETLAAWRTKLQPNFTLLDAVVDCAVAGKIQESSGYFPEW